MTVLRPYQSQGIDAIHARYLQGDRSVCWQLPTGGGKTITFVEISRLSAAAGSRVAILVHRDTLLTQVSRALDAAQIPHGIIAPGYRRTRDLVQVASAQTLARRLDDYAFDLIIIDEAHHATAQTWLKIIAANPTAHVLGVTATPCRTDGRGLDDIFESLVLGPSTAALIADGYLAEPIVYGPAKKVNLAGLRTRMGDYDQRQLSEFMDTPRITGDAIAEYTKRCPGAPAVVFAVSIQHAEDVAALFANAGYRSAVVHGKMPKDAIRHTISGLTDGRVQVLVTCELVSEGVDVPAVVAAILLRPTQSMGLFLQQVGRALRPIYASGPLDTPGQRLAAIAAGAKPHAIILDHAGNCLRFGLPDDEREWTLEGRPRRAKNGLSAAPVRQCMKCLLTHRPAPRCPACGYVYPLAPREVDTAPGELVQIDKEALRRARRSMIHSARTYSALRDVGRKLGYSGQWAYRYAIDNRIPLNS